ncbi:MAG TPA: hypothetical protein VHU83_17725 [Bryobacteraceae bacterium]|jgi:hypothetical protein|nr:hypothetical protein [Bryobacteraceae bacterium]
MPDQHGISGPINPGPSPIRKAVFKIVYRIGVWATAVGALEFGVLTLAEIWYGDWFKITFPPIPIACILCCITWRRVTRPPRIHT